MPIAERDQILPRQPRNRFGGTFPSQGVGMIAEKRVAQNIASDRGELLLVFLDPGELHFPFPLNRSLGESRVQENVGEQFDPEVKIRLGDVNRDAKTVVARVAANAAANGLD